jgi:hypothetical protein
MQKQIEQEQLTVGAGVRVVENLVFKEPETLKPLNPKP